MKLNRLTFENYKGFRERKEIQIRPITVLIGKNSSGKSAIGKLTTLIESSLSENAGKEPLLLVNNGVALGRSFRDIVYNQLPSSPVQFGLNFENVTLNVAVVEPTSEFQPIITEWEYISGSYTLKLNLIREGGVYRSSFDNIEYKCEFRGFWLTKMIEIATGKPYSLEIDKPTIKVDYIGPFRLIPPRTYFLDGRSTHDKIGVFGENAYNILGHSAYAEDSVLRLVSDWFSNNFDGWLLDVKKNSHPILELIVRQTQKHSDFDVNLADVGQGMSQALPIIVRAFMPGANDIIVVEQPELHLHQAVHGNIAELFVNSTLNTNNSYIIETHSENFILRLRKLVAAGRLSEDNVIVYSIEHTEDGTEVREINLRKDGEVDYWPEGVFSESLEEMKAISKAVRQRT